MKPESNWARTDALRILRDNMLKGALDWEQLSQKYSFDLNVLDDPEGTIAISTLYELFEAAAIAADNDAVVFDIFNMAPVGEVSVFDYLFVCAPTIRDGCHAWTRFNTIRSNSYTLEFTEDPSHGTLEWKYQNHHGIWRQNMFARMAWATKRFETSLDCDVAPINIEMACQAPKQLSNFQRRYGSRLIFNASRNAISIPTGYLDAQPKKKDPNLYSIIQQAALEEQALFTRYDSPMNHIADQIAETMKTGTCTLEQISINLGLSQRTVQRLLEEEGTSFRRLTEEIRRAAAKRYLKETSLPMKEIAFLLGFSEISTFSRAVKTWFGVPPKKYRQELASQ